MDDGSFFRLGVITLDGADKRVETRLSQNEKAIWSDLLLATVIEKDSESSCQRTKPMPTSDKDLIGFIVAVALIALVVYHHLCLWLIARLREEKARVQCLKEMNRRTDHAE